VAAIRAAVASGSNYAELGRRYGCSRQAIARIAKGTSFTEGGRRRFGKAKLTDNDIREIRSLYTSGMSQQRIADQFDIHQTAVSGIVRRKNWAHVD
jgi:DNA invertase Pin-like site-specific DNA recombinase